MSSLESRRALVVLFLVGVGLRAILLSRLVDQSSWRECDLAGIARNYDREGMDLFYPRVDWRGTGPGYAEMEFPAYPWLIAVCYRSFGFHEVTGRVLSFLASLGALAVFFRLAREMLTPLGAFFAALFFTLSPLAVTLATALQPEPWMLLAALLAVYWFIRWLRTDSSAAFFAAMMATACAILAKAPAAHLGILFAALLLSAKGWRFLLSPLPWVFALGALVPPILWYVHARGFWLTYGNSLGVSNEYHWVRGDLFTDPRLILGLVRVESLSVWTPFGIVLGCVGAWQVRESQAARLGMLWFLSALAFYIVAIRTTSSDWAYYYHIASVPPAALLVGVAAEVAWRWRARKMRLVLFSLLLAGTFLGELAGTGKIVEKKLRVDPIYREALALRSSLPEEGLILVSGGSQIGQTGYPVAYNNSYLFYWLDRKGFNISMEQLSMSKIREFQDQGARYFIAEKKNHLVGAPEFAVEVRATYPVVAESAELVAFRLVPREKEPHQTNPDRKNEGP